VLSKVSRGLQTITPTAKVYVEITGIFKYGPSPIQAKGLPITNVAKKIRISKPVPSKIETHWDW